VPFPLHRLDKLVTGDSTSSSQATRQARHRRLDKLDAGETTGSKVPYLSLFHARAALRPEVVPVVNRTPPTLLPGPK